MSEAAESKQVKQEFKRRYTSAIMAFTGAMVPLPSQQHEGLQHVVFPLQPYSYTAPFKVS